MPSFKGHSLNSVDAKGRIAIPAKMRAAMNPEAGGRFTVVDGLDGCLQLYPDDVWAQKEEEMSRLNEFRADVRKAIRVLLFSAEDLELDKQGRVTLSRERLDKFGIGDKALVVGAFRHIEIWDEDRYNAYMGDILDEAELVQDVMGGDA
jgi:MraZ protein